MVLKFIALGDMGSGDKEQYKVAKGIEKIIENLKKKHLKNISFIVGLGDNIYEYGVNSVSDKQFKTKFEKPYKNINKKFYMSLGNHDYSYPELEEGFQQSPQHQIDYTNMSKKWFLPSKYYKYSYNIEKGSKVDFFVIDTNIDRMEKKEQDTQLKYLIDMINKSTAKWKILYGHHPWRSVAGHGHAEEELEVYFRKLIKGTKKNSIDLYMCGHDHNKQYIELTYNKDITIPLIVCGTGGKIYDLPLPKIENCDDNDYNIHFYSNTLGFLCVKIFPSHMIIYFFNDKGDNVEFMHTIKK